MADGGLCIRIIEDRWKQFPHLRKIIRQAVSVVWDLKSSEISIVLADDDFIQDLNHRYRGKNSPTNVLSFPDGDITPEGITLAGDIILSYQTLLKESEKIGFQNHLIHLIIHGCLHLKGFDHISDDEAEIMQQTEIQLLKKFGIKDPYQ